MLQLINKGFQDCGRQVIGLWFCDEQLTLMTVSTPLGMSWCQKFLKVFGFLSFLQLVSTQREKRCKITVHRYKEQVNMRCQGKLFWTKKPSLSRPGFGHTHITLQQHEHWDLKIFDISWKLKARETKAREGCLGNEGSSNTGIVNMIVAFFLCQLAA